MRNLKFPKNTGSGVADYVLLAPVSWFADIKCPAPPFTDPGDEVLIMEDHIFFPGKGFIQVLLAPEKNQLTGTSIGDLGFQKMDQTLEIFIPGSYGEVHEFAKNIINIPLIVLSKDSNCISNMWYQLGCDCVYAWAKMDFSTGTTREGIKGYSGTITYLSGYIQLYQGYIQKLDPDGVITTPLFLAATSVNQIVGNRFALASLYGNAQATSMDEIYLLVLEQATEGIISIGYATSSGDIYNDLIIDVDLSSLESFIDAILQWLFINGDGKSLELVDDRLLLSDDDNAIAYMGIAVPQNLFGDDDIILLADDDEILITS